MKSDSLRLKGATFTFRKRDATMKDVPRLLDSVNGELEKDFERFREWDAAMYTSHYRAAYDLDPARGANLRHTLEVLENQTYYLQVWSQANSSGAYSLVVE